MERVKALINKLQEQAQQNAGAATLLATVQQLQAELSGGVAALPKQLGTAKVAVVMPNHSRFMPPVAETRDSLPEDSRLEVEQLPVAAKEELQVQKKTIRRAGLLIR